jgi:uncharacterized repeat protein (TIGR03803 family)
MIGRTLGLLAFAFLLAAGGAKAQTFSTLYNFCSQPSCADGASPQTGLIADAAGNLYGTTSSAVFELSPNGSGGWTYSVVHVFCSQPRCTGGSGPSGPLIIDSAGDLYGVTRGGGKTDYGVAYELIPQGGGKWTSAVLRSFCTQISCLDGGTPSGTLAYFGQSSGAPYDGTSPLYGTTQAGGAYQKGTVVMLTPPPSGAKRTWWKSRVLHSFCPEGGNCLADGYQPSSGVVVAANNALYGTTYYGGQFYVGTLFKLARSGGVWTNQVVHTFCGEKHCADGYLPLGLSQSATGELFGVTAYGPHRAGCIERNCGTIFEMSPQAGTFKTLYSFCSLEDCADGYGPSGPVTILDNGDLVGVTGQGGDRANHYPQGGGVLYRLSGTTLSVLHDFCALSNCDDGFGPGGSVVVDGQGRIFGTAGAGGANQGGTIYEFAP